MHYINMYLTWSKKTIIDFSDANINSLYNEGYLFTRTGKGDMYQTRSLRVDLKKFKLSSENRRILKKTENLLVTSYELPVIPPQRDPARCGTNYHWSIGKMAKDFYDTKFGKETFSANKVKELLTTEHNFNLLLSFILRTPTLRRGTKDLSKPMSDELQKTNVSPSTFSSKDSSASPRNEIAYAICRETNALLHYSYPFYDLKATSYKLIPNLGLGMMLKAILYAQEHKKHYVYLGSAQRPNDTYKLQFEGLGWFDGKEWKQNLNDLKKILK